MYTISSWNMMKHDKSYFYLLNLKSNYLCFRQNFIFRYFFIILQYYMNNLKLIAFFSFSFILQPVFFKCQAHRQLKGIDCFFFIGFHFILFFILFYFSFYFIFHFSCFCFLTLTIYFSLHKTVCTPRKNFFSQNYSQNRIIMNHLRSEKIKFTLIRKIFHVSTNLIGVLHV